MISIKVYTSGTMQADWRSELERLYGDLVREQVRSRWQPQNVPPDYLRPRQEISDLVSALHWYHPSTPPVGGGTPGGPSFYVPRNLRLIRDCDVLLSCIYPGYESIDSAHEVGVAYAWSKPVVTIDLTRSAPDYAAWRAMSLVVLEDLQQGALFLLYQIQGSPSLNLTPVGATLTTTPAQDGWVRHSNGYTHREDESHTTDCSVT